MRRSPTCPIVPFAVATSRYRAVKSWDRMTINLPFSKLGIVMGDPIEVLREAGARELEIYRQRVEVALNESRRCGECSSSI